MGPPSSSSHCAGKIKRREYQWFSVSSCLKCEVIWAPLARLASRAISHLLLSHNWIESALVCEDRRGSSLWEHASFIQHQICFEKLCSLNIRSHLVNPKSNLTFYFLFFVKWSARAATYFELMRFLKIRWHILYKTHSQIDGPGVSTQARSPNQRCAHWAGAQPGGKHRFPWLTLVSCLPQLKAISSSFSSYKCPAVRCWGFAARHSVRGHNISSSSGLQWASVHLQNHTLRTKAELFLPKKNWLACLPYTS